MGPLREFLRLEAAGGLLLMAATAVALVVANSPLRSWHTRFLELPLEVRIGGLGLAKPLLLWINDGLMAIFFLLVGMELKREVLEGHLSSVRRATLPAFAALGGMLVPALIYAGLNRGDPLALRGWAMPTATDIAFALGVLSLLGARAPAALKAFLLSVAIFDDLGAIVVIALFYSRGLSGVSLGIAAALIVALAVLNRAGVERPAPYFLLGVPLWIAVLKSGVHATLAGVVLAMFIPLRSRKASGEEGTASLLRRLEHTLHPWVAFGVLPIFAFANAGVHLGGLTPADTLQSLPLGIILGLLLGKQLGVLSFCLLAVVLRLAAPPEGVSWRQLHGAALLCGIGFTMSLFIASLAFEQAPAGPGLDRLGILLGSLASGLLGYLALRLAPRP
jgi:NhaA family Na+:H+ antiporter